MKTVKVKIKKDPLFKNIKRHKVLPIFNDLIWPTLLFSLLFFFMRMTTNPIWIIHVFSINMSANITRVPSYHAIPTCLLYYQERFMHFFSFCHNFPHVCFIPFLHTKTKQFSFYIRNSNNHISISYMEHMLLISPWCYQKIVVDKYSQETYLWILSRTRNVKIYSMHVV